MKKTAIAAMMFLAVTCVFPLYAQQSPDAMGVIMAHYAARSFIPGAIPRADLDLIIQAGIRAPSARNMQPWHFTVVQNLALARRIVPQTVEGNVIFVISAAGDSRINYVEILDSGLAAQSINLAAQALGYGARIYTTPVNYINSNLKSELGFPAGYSAIALVRVGRVDSVDAVSAASGRRPADTLVTFK